VGGLTGCDGIIAGACGTGPIIACRRLGSGGK
jgi:hypothetical protein